MSTIPATRARVDALEAEIRALADLPTSTLEQDRRLDAAIVELKEARRADIIRLAETQRHNPELRADYHAPNQNYGRPADEVTDRGRQVIDENFRSGRLPAAAAEKATGLIEAGYSGERSIAGKWATAAGDPAYRGAFVKLLADPHRGHLLWTPQEADAYRNVIAVQAEMEGRANMGIASTGIGAAMIPLTLDPAILITNDGSNNPLRQLATIKQTMTNTWQGVTSAGATSEWKTEAAEAGDGAPTLASPSIPVFLADSFVAYSYEIGQDGENFLDELAKVLVDSLDNLMAAAYTTGNGTTAPQGIVTGLVGTASEINGQGSEALAATDPFDLQNALPARFSTSTRMSPTSSIGWPTTTSRLPRSRKAAIRLSLRGPAVTITPSAKPWAIWDVRVSARPVGPWTGKIEKIRPCSTQPCWMPLTSAPISWSSPFGKTYRCTKPRRWTAVRSP